MWFLLLHLGRDDTGVWVNSCVGSNGVSQSSELCGKGERVRVRDGGREGGKKEIKGSKSLTKTPDLIHA